ncbi:MAG TPA: glycosyltransferase [Streptosporangiaceae bacterium]
MTPARHAEAQRIVVLVKRFPRLSETFILNEFLELRRHGLPVELFAIMDPNERRSQPEALALVPEVTYLQTGRLWRELPAALRAARRHPWGTMRAAGWALTRHTHAAGRNLLHALVLLDRLASGPPAHLHAHFLHSPAAVAFIAAKVSGQPYSLTGHAKDIYTTLPENLRMRCDRARFVTTCTEANRTHLITEVGLAPGQMHVCRHGIDLTKFTIPARRPRPGCIVSVGRLVPKKGFDILIQACGDLRRRGIAFELVLLGGGELHDELLALARQQGIGDRVSLLGSRPQSDVVEQLTAAEIFALSPVVLPDGDRDGVPNVLLEAMAVGVAVVATTVSGIPEVVTDGETGRLVPPQRPDLLADALEQLLTDPAVRTRLGEAGRRFVHEHASWTSAITPLLALLEGELARPTRKPSELTSQPSELTMSQQG